MEFDKQTQFACLILAVLPLGYALSVWFPALFRLLITFWGIIGLLYTRVLLQTLHTVLSSPLRRLPSAPEDTLFFGHALKVLQRPSVQTLLRWMQTTANDGLLRVSGICHLNDGVVVTSPDVAYEILTTKASKFHKPPHVRKWLETLMGGGGIITAEGHEHTMQRKMMTRIFTNTATLGLVPLSWSKARRLTDIISDRLANQQSNNNTQEKSAAGVLDLAPLSADITLDIISIAIFGRDLDCATNAEEPMHRAWSFLANPDASNGALNTYFVYSALLPTWLTRNFPSLFVRTFNMHRQSLRDLCASIVAEQRSDAARKERKDILSLLVQDKAADASTDTQIVDQMLTFLAAGHDTTSGTFLWAIWLLSLHTDAQTQVRKEIQRLLAKLRDGDATFDGHSLDMLPYTTAVANEAMRLFPTVAMTARQPYEDVEIGGVLIPKGTQMYISPWAMQRMADAWGVDAGDFNPDRWLGDDGELDHSGGASSPHAFLTFLNGSRSCIGQHFARNELRCLIAALVSRFEAARVEQDDGKLQMSGIITVQPKNGMRVYLKEV